MFLRRIGNRVPLVITPTWDRPRYRQSPCPAVSLPSSSRPTRVRSGARSPWRTSARPGRRGRRHRSEPRQWPGRGGRRPGPVPGRRGCARAAGRNNKNDPPSSFSPGWPCTAERTKSTGAGSRRTTQRGCPL
jgi:hypothetical protein